jgi:pyruvate/2-oxoglutarate dehydrogenase complex dihydrolipoamide acyltransferase (E2) component
MADDIVLADSAWEGVEARTEALVERWLVAQGSPVEAGAPLVRVVLVKSSIDVTAPRAGRLAQVLVPAGETFRRGQPLGRLDA